MWTTALPPGPENCTVDFQLRGIERIYIRQALGPLVPVR